MLLRLQIRKLYNFFLAFMNNDPRSPDEPNIVLNTLKTKLTFQKKMLLNFPLLFGVLCSKLCTTWAKLNVLSWNYEKIVLSWFYVLNSVDYFIFRFELNQLLQVQDYLSTFVSHCFNLFYFHFLKLPNFLWLSPWWRGLK